MGDSYTLRFDPANSAQTPAQASPESPVNPAGRLTGRGAPNRYTAPYELGEGQAISIQPIAGTLMASFREPPGLSEGDYFAYLEGAVQWDLSTEKLYLKSRGTAGEEVTLVFAVKAE
jgi:heat shock protein HslJ